MKTKRNQPASSKNAAPPPVRIRMYRVGFGDCFLVTLSGTHHILIDCGVHAKGNVTAGGESLIDKAFRDIEQVTGKMLDIVIATHAHQDHVSGFGKFADQFREFSIAEVWMPWTEDLSNSTARKWHTKTKSLLELIGNRLHATGDLAAAAAAENAGANPKAMQALREGFGGARVRYLKAGDTVSNPGGITGLSAKILGPSQDQSFISKMDPPASDHYLRMAADTLAGNPVRPFAGWELQDSQLLDEWPRLDAKRLAMLAEGASFPASAVAFALDRLLNNTSIVALFEWRGKQLLFPGDAQYGDWTYWYKNNGAEILSNICFYKVSHHGSLNATPKGAVEEMPAGAFAAMMSTQNKPWPSIPRKGLVDALVQRTGGALARADALSVPGAENSSDPSIPAGFVAGNEAKDQYWIDYCIR